MEKDRQLYPLRFIAEETEKIWGTEKREIADLGFADSVVAEGWLAGNTIGEIMETYLEKIPGEDVYRYYGRQFPIMVKLLDIRDRISLQVHPDDETAAQRYDALGKSTLWYIMEASPDAVIYAGFNREVTAQELYYGCLDGSVEKMLNVIRPKKGDCLLIKPGTVHAAGGGLLVAEIQESSALDFRLYDWGREQDPAAGRETHIEEAIDIIDYGTFDDSLYRSAGHRHDGEIARKLAETPEFTVTELAVTDPLHIYTEKFGRFIIYVCTEGEVSIQVPGSDGKTSNHYLKKGETILIPASMPDFFIVPADRDSILLEAMVERRAEDDDAYSPEDEEPDGDWHDEDCGCGHDEDCGCGHHGHGHDCRCGHGH